ncbi:hypothetical protein CVS40_3830 [Lucilia cuprina]|nr:hypothetical protein CVS40_3830 [Lucilia cuprina]KAI8126043.1 hypothetical protein CVS40_3830 [Lucilia cuprina]
MIYKLSLCFFFQLQLITARNSLQTLTTKFTFKLYIYK